MDMPIPSNAQGLRDLKKKEQSCQNGLTHKDQELERCMRNLAKRNSAGVGASAGYPGRRLQLPL
jgi:hypothetical protein